MVQPAKLSREMILREAIALLQEGGLDMLTLRRLADRLGARAPSLARHVGDKGRLVSLVSSTIFLDALDEIPPGLTGDAWLIGYGRALRDKQRATRDVTALVATAPGDAEMGEIVGTRLRGVLGQAGLGGEDAMREQAAIQALVTGWILFEMSPRAPRFSSRQARDAAFDEALAALVAGFAARRAN